MSTIIAQFFLLVLGKVVLHFDIIIFNLIIIVPSLLFKLGSILGLLIVIDDACPIILLELHLILNITNKKLL